jgi:hypothetical protein
LIERGEVAVLRVPTGEDAGPAPCGPALLEFEEAGTLCFYMDADRWRTISVSADRRVEIMDLASQLQPRMTAIPKATDAR